MDFDKHDYVIAYSPRFEDQPHVISATAKVVSGQAQDEINNYSECEGLNIIDSGDGIVVCYNLDRNPLGFGKYSAYLTVRKGNTLGKRAYCRRSNYYRSSWN